MTKLHVISSYGPAAASTRVRLYDWVRILGIDATHHCYAGLNNNRPSSIASHAIKVALAETSLHRLNLKGQTVLLSRQASPFSRGHIEERVLRSAAHGTYDFDDAIFHVLSPSRHMLGIRDTCRRAIKAADVVIAGNDYLANWAAHYNKDVRVIPSCIDPADYAPKTEWSTSEGAPSLVWLGSHSTEVFVAQIVPALLEVHRQTGASLTLISDARPNARLDPLHHMLRRIPWKIETFASGLASADVAIAPLDNAPYSRGKCAYKLLQYAAAGLPIVGSPVGANELALRRFKGLEARTSDDWIQGLLQILTGPTSGRMAMGVAGQNAVKAHYSFDAWESQWRAAVGVATFTGLASGE